MLLGRVSGGLRLGSGDLIALSLLDSVDWIPREASPLPVGAREATVGVLGSRNPARGEGEGCDEGWGRGVLGAARCWANSPRLKLLPGVWRSRSLPRGLSDAGLGFRERSLGGL